MHFHCLSHARLPVNRAQIAPGRASKLPSFLNMVKEMIGGCCVCSDERGWDENPLVYCDGHGCNVAVHQGTGRGRLLIIICPVLGICSDACVSRSSACYGIVQVPKGPWFCRKCESQERIARVVS